MIVLHAWAIPANVIGSWADHTWVTTYDNRIRPLQSLADVAAAKEHLWMCWGSFHPVGQSVSHLGGYLGSASGDLAFSRCLVKSNADSVHVAAARGTVQAYGIHGVCHQVANQVLFSTAAKGKQPMSVKGCRGYSKSIYLYGQYGRKRQAWAARVRYCAGSTAFNAEIDPMFDQPDDFEVRAAQILVDRNDLLQALLAMRAEYQAQLDQLDGRPDVSAEDVDRRHFDHLTEVANLLGEERFVQIFEQSPDDEMNLVDPAIFEASRPAGTAG